jgi:hypothetical protein
MAAGDKMGLALGRPQVLRRRAGLIKALLRVHDNVVPYAAGSGAEWRTERVISSPNHATMVRTDPGSVVMPRRWNTSIRFPIGVISEARVSYTT